ncbi:carbohydrate esterase family 4 protein [[Candida] arabinofermentans NRRL YB-2248]|uniref:Carbohydrate esterase family 4 protein n=1 Tax=[Candida] arabinofermentans NRRL YB-2248 TaxID=983967 RepID=A0A1E4SXC0_9ASCO|nr:carbohydrate esterase family 4 protein [[Candida] arabinofermentans NRRL YB-2248]
MEATTAIEYPKEVNKDKNFGTKYEFPRDLVGYGEAGLDCNWPDEKKVAISFVLNYEEGGERSLTLGEDTTEFNLYTGSKGLPLPFRAIDVESEYDYGARAGVWRVLRLFKQYDMKLTAYAVGRALERNLEVAKAFVRDGHEIASHAYRWIPYADLKPEEEKAFILKQMKSLKETTGVENCGWYMGRPSSQTMGLLCETYKELGLQLPYFSDYYGDDVPRWVDVPAEKNLPSEEKEGMLLVPYSLDCNDYRFLNANGFRSEQAFLDHLINAFDTLYEEGGKMMTVGLHCRIIGKPGYYQALKKFVEYINRKPDIWVCTRAEIASHFKEKFPYQPN